MPNLFDPNHPIHPTHLQNTQPIQIKHPLPISLNKTLNISPQLHQLVLEALLEIIFFIRFVKFCVVSMLTSSSVSSPQQVESHTCKCGLIAKYFTAMTRENGGRRFFKCCRPGSFSCGYWIGSIVNFQVMCH